MFRLPVVAVCFLLFFGAQSAFAETLFSAMATAYETNPDIEAARAGLRASDENIAIAKAGRRPTIAAEATAQWQDVESTVTKSASVSLSVTQSIFDGFRTKNSILAAQSRILSGRQTLLSTEMDILITVAQAYVDVLLNQQISSIRDQNLDFLEEQLRGARARLDVGEGTKTDVSQADASLAAARAQLIAANANLKASHAIYRQVVGHNASGLKVPNVPVKIMPRNLNMALGLGLSEHPALVSANHTIEAAAYDVKVKESALLPGVNLSGSFKEADGGVTTAQISARLTVPLYSGGANHASVRQSKENLGEARIRLDSVRRSVEQVIIDAWVNYESAKAAIKANDAQVRAARLALSGTIEEQKVGQRTTLDVLNSQANVLTARESLVQSQRNMIVAAYNVLYATGQLTASKMGLGVNIYRPEDHYEAVEDKWFGLRTVTAQ